jgi:hypothetical protein
MVKLLSCSLAAACRRLSLLPLVTRQIYGSQIVAYLLRLPPSTCHLLPNNLSPAPYRSSHRSRSANIACKQHWLREKKHLPCAEKLELELELVLLAQYCWYKVWANSTVRLAVMQGLTETWDWYESLGSSFFSARGQGASLVTNRRNLRPLHISGKIQA